MTKDQMRQLLTTLVPAAIAEGNLYRFNRVGAGTTHDAAFAVRGKPSATPQVQTKPVRPMRIKPRQGVNGAGFEVQTFKPFQTSNQPLHPVGAFATLSPPHQPFFCALCDCHGADCTC